MAHIKKSSSKVDRARALPWAAALQAVVIVGRRWKALSARDRQRVKDLLSESGGRIDNLTGKQRKELRKLASKLDLKGMGKELLALRGGRGRLGRRR